MKTCHTCGVTKPLDEFHAHPHMADGRLGQCKECKRAYAAAYRKQHLLLIRAKQTQANRSEENRVKRRERVRLGVRRHEAKYPQKCRARRVIRNAVFRGRIKRQCCEVCGSPNAQAHHVDYSRPLDVKWLCLTHHHQALGHCEDKC